MRLDVIPNGGTAGIGFDSMSPFRWDGIEIYIATDKPYGLPEENRLPINRKIEDRSVAFLIDVLEKEKMKTWEAPKAE